MITEGSIPIGCGVCELNFDDPFFAYFLFSLLSRTLDANIVVYNILKTIDV